MQLNKVSPKWCILADTKINPATLERWLEEGTDNKKFNDGYHRRNGVTSNTNNCEKLLELFGQEILGISNQTATNLEYIKANWQTLTPILRHMHVTVMFDNVSKLFLEDLINANAGTAITNKLKYDLSLYLPDAIGTNTEATKIYGSLLGALNDKLTDIENVQTLPPDLRQLLLKLLHPYGSACRIVCTANLLDWKALFLHPWTSEETRYTFIHLLKDFKARYLGALWDLAYQNETGQILGSGSLDTKGLWNQLNIVKHP